MKTKIFKNLLFAAVMAMAVSSCLKTGDEKVYTAEEEKLLRDEYLSNLAAKGHKIDTTANGVYYVVTREGEGEFAKTGDSLTIGYAGYFVDGSMFDASEFHYADGKMRFILGEDRMVDGFEDAMTVLNKNAKAEFVIPSELAYGSQGSYGMPPYQTLVFVIEMFEIRPVEVITD